MFHIEYKESIVLQFVAQLEEKFAYTFFTHELHV